jgi:hypothetical protein
MDFAKSSSERRSARRYVIDGLMVTIGGVRHETIDVSASSVAVVRKPGVDYRTVRPPFRFILANARIDQAVASITLIYERGVKVVLKYDPPCAEWDDVLARHHVLADVVTLEDIFG